MLLTIPIKFSFLRRPRSPRELPAYFPVLDLFLNSSLVALKIPST